MPRTPFTDPTRDRRAWNRLATRYRAARRHHALFLARLGRDALFGHYYTRTVEYPLALAWLDPRAGDTVLDVGAGDGPFPLFLARRGALVLALDRGRGVDGGRWARRHAARGGIARGRARYLRADATSLPLADASVDRACAVSALEHFPGAADARAMAELARVLRPGGRAFVSVEAAAEPLEVRARHVFPVGHGLGGAPDTQLVRYYDPRALAERLALPAKGLALVAAWWFADRGRPLRAAFDEPTVRARAYPFAIPLAWTCFQRLRGPAELAGLPRASGNHSNAIACLLFAKAIASPGPVG